MNQIKTLAKHVKVDQSHFNAYNILKSLIQMNQIKTLAKQVESPSNSIFNCNHNLRINYSVLIK